MVLLPRYCIVIGKAAGVGKLPGFTKAVSTKIKVIIIVIVGRAITGIILLLWAEP